MFFKNTILIQARASQSYSQTALICTHFEQLSYFHMEAKSFPLWGLTQTHSIFFSVFSNSGAYKMAKKYLKKTVKNVKIPKLGGWGEGVRRLGIFPT